MIDFLIRSWFEAKEKRTQKSFSKMEKTLFADRVDEIKSFCDRCWDSEEWKNVNRIYSKYFPDVRSVTYILSSDPPRLCSWVYDELANAYEAFTSSCDAGMDSLIQTYNKFYDELCQNTDLTPGEINIFGFNDRITYELYRDYNGKFKPAFNRYAEGWSEKYHEAYCAMTNLMIIIRKSCDIIDDIRRSTLYKNAYPHYCYYEIKRKDRPVIADYNAIYTQIKEKLEAEYGDKDADADTLVSKCIEL